MIVVSDGLSAELEGSRREIAVVVWEPVLDGAAENGLIACCRDLILVGKSGSVAIDGLRHAKRASLCRHQPGKARLIAPRASATMTATSLADFVTMARIAVSTRIDSPGFSPSLEGACTDAWADTGRSALSLSFPCSNRSNNR